MKKRRIGRSFVSLLIVFVFTSQAIVPVCGEEIRIDGTTTGGIITAGVSSIFAEEDEILISDETTVLFDSTESIVFDDSVAMQNETISINENNDVEILDVESLEELKSVDRDNSEDEIRRFDSESNSILTYDKCYTQNVDTYLSSAGTAGIKDNGLGGIYIDIYGEPFKSFEKLVVSAYKRNGCGWFASARAKQITGSTAIKTVKNHEGWYKNGYAEACGFSKGSEIKAPSLVCWSGHIAILERIDGKTYYFSEGGSGYAPNNDYTRIFKKNSTEIDDYLYKNSDGNGDFWGFVYLASETGCPIGCIDSIGADNGKLDVGGWAYDPDSPSTSIQINVYVEGRTDPIASFKTHIHRDIAGGTNCGFDETIDISNLGLSGKKKVSLWGIDVTGDDNAEIGSKEVDFDTYPPTPMPGESPYDPEIENGKYVLMSALRSDTHLNIEGNDKSDDDDNVNVERGFDEDSYYDVFKVSLLENGYYKLIQNGTNHMAVSVAGRSTSEDANIQMYYWNPEDLSNTEFQWAIKWAKKQDGKPYHYLRARCSGMYMTTAGSGNGKNVYQASKDSDDDYQKWFFARYMKPSIETDSLPNGSVGQSYNATLEADSDLDVAWTFTGKDDSLPPGLSLERSGKITGTPTTPGTYTFSLDAENALVDALGLSTRKYTIVIEGDIPVTGVTLDKSSLELNEGASATLTATVSPDNATDKSVTWKSSDEKIATVSSSGKVTAVKEGTATITVTSNSNKDKSASCKVTVKKNNISVTSVTLDKTSLEINAGSTSVLTATVKPDNATDKSVTWKSSDEKIATVSSSGKVTAVKEGTATITVTSNSNKDKSASCKVTVKSKPTGIVIKADDVSGAAGSTVSVPVRITGNPGLGGLSLTITSDPALSIESVEKGSILSSGTFEQNKDTGLAQWYTRESAATGDGILFVVKFSVKNGAEKKNYPVNIAFKDGKKENVADINGNTLNVSLIAGSVNTNRILGDITGDGIIAIGDVVRLARAVAGNIILTDDERAVADINGDKVIAIGDVVRLARYVEGSITEL